MSHRCLLLHPLSYLLALVSRSVTASGASFSDDVWATFHGDSSGHMCGTWQSSYTAFHKQELSKGDDARIMVAVPVRSGLADRITGLVTIFMWALASKRAFQIGNVPGLRPLEDAFHSPSIDWTRPLDPDWLLEPFHENAVHFQFNDTVFPHTFAAVNLIGSRSDDVPDNDLLMHHSDARVILASTNRGRTVRLFEQPTFRQALKSTGLSAETAFGCFVNYLLKPISEDFKHLHTQTSLTSNPGVIKIGVQIRVGDAFMHKSPALQDFQVFFSCAEQIEQFLSHRGNVLWVLASDSQQLRRSAVAQYGGKVVTADIIPEHSSKESSVCERDCQVSLDGFRTAAGKWWLLGTCNFYVISANSGFGRTAAFRSLQRNGIYVIDPLVSKKCTDGRFDHYTEVSAQWAGI